MTIPSPTRNEASWPSVVLALVAVCFTLAVGKNFFLPLILAVMLRFVFRPPVNALARRGIPHPVGAALLLIALLAALVYGFVQLAEPALEWAERAPGSLARVEHRLQDLKEPVEQVSRATEQVERMATVDDGEGETQVEIKEPGLRDAVVAGTWSIGARTAVTTVLLFFLLASGDRLSRRIVRALPDFSRRRRGLRILHAVERETSRYLFTISLINLGLGATVALALMAWGMPNPLLWGVMAAVLNFIPYLGALVGVGVVTLAGLLTFDDPVRAGLVALTYLALTALEGNFVTPMVLGRRLALSQIAIFVGLMFWSSMWGMAGALLAVPILMVFKILSDHVDRLAPLRELLRR